MGDYQYLLHSNTVFLHPIKLGSTPVYPINPIHGYIDITYRKYQNNVYDYHLVKNMNRALKKIVVTAIDKQWIKVAKYMVMGYAKNSFVEMMDWMYVRYI